MSTGPGDRHEREASEPDPRAPPLRLFATAMLVGAVLVGIMKESKLIQAAK